MAQDTVGAAGTTTGAGPAAQLGTVPAGGPTDGLLGGLTGGSSKRLPFTITPSFSATETFTRGDSLVSGQTRSEFITQLSPSLHVDAGTGRIRGFIDYSLIALNYARESSSSDLRQALNASGHAELIENRVYIDANANIGQQAVSAFGPQFIDSTLSRANRSEVVTYSVTPSLRGTLAGLVDYSASVAYSASRSDSTAAADNTSTSAQVQLRGRPELSRIGWSLTGSHQVLGYNDTRNATTDSVSAGLNYAFTPQFQGSVNVGSESSTLADSVRQTVTTSGFGLNWRPSETTSLSANIGRRAFGNTHALAFSHRSGRTVWTYTDTRDVSTGALQPTLGSLGTTYDLFYQLFASSQPDPVLRAKEVNDYLLARGINPNTQVLGGFLASATTLQRSQTLSAALSGLRDTVTVSLSQTSSSRLDSSAAVTDDLSANGVVRQQGFSLGLAHRLTPVASLNLALAQQRTTGNAGAPNARLSSLSASWSSQLGRYTSATLTASRSVFNNPTSPYTETALTAALRLQF